MTGPLYLIFIWQDGELEVQAWEDMQHWRDAIVGVIQRVRSEIDLGHTREAKVYTYTLERAFLQVVEDVGGVVEASCFCCKESRPPGDAVAIAQGWRSPAFVNLGDYTWVCPKCIEAGIAPRVESWPA